MRAADAGAAARAQGGRCQSLPNRVDKRQRRRVGRRALKMLRSESELPVEVLSQPELGPGAGPGDGPVPTWERAVGPATPAR